MTRTILAASLLATAAFATPAIAQDAPEEVARAALEAAPVWDGHNDVPGRLRGQYGNVLADFDFHDTLEGDDWTPGQMHTDLARLRTGMVGAQWWSVYVSAALDEPEAVFVLQTWAAML